MAHDHSQHHRQPLGYTNFSSENDLLTHSFQASHEQELYSLPAAPAMEMLRISSKPHHSSGSDDQGWRAASFAMVVGSSSAATAAASSFTQPPDEEGVTAAVSICPWPPPNVDDSSARFLFPSNAPPRSRSLSLSLNQAEASNSGYGHHPLFHYRVLSNPRDHSNLLQKATGFQQQLLKGSKYLIPARELLNEFCKLNTSSITGSSKQKASAAKHEEEGASSSSSSSALNHALSNLDTHELQARKAKLIRMVEEVDRRYRKYRDQMKAVVLSFEEVAGEGAATVYSTLASKVMSRHFRCLRDAITGQIQAIRRQMGENDAPAPASTRSETPRLKVIDQCLRQHKAFQQVGMIENHPWRPQRGLPERSVTILRAWLFEHFLHPYPSDVDKHILARQTGLSRSQVSNWFINARVRLWKPMVEEMYLEETKEEELNSNNQASRENNYNSDQEIMHSDQNQNPIYSSFQVLELEEQKPATDSDSLSCIINNSSGRRRDCVGSSIKSSSQAHHPHSNAGGQQFGVVDLDFTSYNNQWGGGHGSAGGVSLTLGLQQHNGRGTGLSFSPPPAATQAPSLLFSGQQMEECGPSQFAILDGETTQNLRYRSFMEAQFLHDLTG